MSLTQAQKEKVFSDIKSYIAGEWKEKTKKESNQKFIEKLSAAIEKANIDQISFGKNPSFERGYIFGNVTASGDNRPGDITYTRTINENLQSPEIFFWFIDKDVPEETCKKARAYMSSMKNFSKDDIIAGLSKTYKIEEKLEAFKDYAEPVCKKQLSRIDYSLTNFRVNECTFFETTPITTCDFYPIFFEEINEKGKKHKHLVGYYNAEDDLVHPDISIPMTTAKKIGCTVAIIAIVGIYLFFYYILPSMN